MYDTLEMCLQFQSIATRKLLILTPQRNTLTQNGIQDVLFVARTPTHNFTPRVLYHVSKTFFIIQALSLTRLC
jgi:hypothetical protein